MSKIDKIIFKINSYFQIFFDTFITIALVGLCFREVMSFFNFIHERFENKNKQHDINSDAI